MNLWFRGDRKARSACLPGMSFMIAFMDTSPVEKATSQPELADDGAGVVLRPFDYGDTASVLRAFGDAEISFWHGRKMDALADAERWIERRTELWRTGGGADWAVCLD